MDHLKAAVCFSAMRVFTASISFAHHEESGDIRSSHVVCSYQNRVVAYEYVTLPDSSGIGRTGPVMSTRKQSMNQSTPGHDKRAPWSQASA